jgi:nucleotide-binding universal stress UspA family protein
MRKRTALIPLDGSPFSRQIVSHVCHLLDPEEYALVLLRVAEPVAGLIGAPPKPVSAGWPSVMYEHERDVEYASHPIFATQQEASERAAIEHELLEDQRRLAQAGYSVSVVVQFGDPAQQIVTFAEEHAVDVVAMATHGRTGLQHLVLGSVAEHVLRSVTIPVVRVRPSIGKVEKP